jgi:cbb3-type cytochrome oxidase cytochrome c subunit
MPPVQKNKHYFEEKEMKPIDKLKSKIDNLEIYEGCSTCHSDLIKYQNCTSFSKQLEKK